jgi:hypothetical protein
VPNPKDRSDLPTTRKERVSALDERLADLRTKLEARITPVPAEPGTGDRTSEPGAPPSGRMRDVESLALLVYGSLKGDAVQLRRFVHELGRLEARAKSGA